MMELNNNSNASFDHIVIFNGNLTGIDSACAFKAFLLILRKT